MKNILKRLGSAALFAAILLGLPLHAADAQSQQYQVKISQLPVPNAGSTFLSAGDVVGANRNNVTYRLTTNFGSGCLAHQWVSAISAQGYGTCTQPGFSDIAGLGTAASANLGTSGATVPLLSSNVTWSGTNIFTSSLPTVSNGNLALGASTTAGGEIKGKGSTFDISILNGTGSSICTVVANGTTLNCGGLQVNGVNVLTTSGGVVTLGSSTTANPQVNGLATTGFYATTSGQPAVEVSGSQIQVWTTAGSSLAGVTTVNNFVITGTCVGCSSGVVGNGLANHLPWYSALGTTVTGSLLGATVTGTADAITNAYFDATATGNTFKVAGQAITATKGNTATVATTSGSVISGHGAAWDASGNLVDAGPSASGLTLLATVNASSASTVTFNSSVITSTYNKYVVEFDSLTASGQDTLILQTSANNGGTYATSSYQSAVLQVPANTISSTSSGIAIAGVDNVTSNNGLMQGTIKFSKPSGSTLTLFNVFSNGRFNGGAELLYIESGELTTNGAINNIRIVPLGSTTFTGNFHLYGLQGT